jgi:hypothetical protein
VTSFFDQYKQALSLIRVGVNHWYDSDWRHFAVTTMDGTNAFIIL